MGIGFGFPIFPLNLLPGFAVSTQKTPDDPSAQTPASVKLWAWNWILWIKSQFVSDETRLTKLERKVADMLKEIQDLVTAADAFKASVTADVSTLQSQLKDLQDQVAQLKSQPTVSADDLAAIEAKADELAATGAAIHASVNPPAAG